MRALEAAQRAVGLLGLESLDAAVHHAPKPGQLFHEKQDLPCVKPPARRRRREPAQMAAGPPVRKAPGPPAEGPGGRKPRARAGR